MREKKKGEMERHTYSCPVVVTIELHVNCLAFSKMAVHAFFHEHEVLFEKSMIMLTFQDRLKKKLQKSLFFETLFGEEIEHIQKRRFSYTEDLDEDRLLEPDHIYVDKKNRKLTVVEVKYSNNIAVRDHVAQLISYLDFQYAEWNGFEKVGLVVYPGNIPSCEKLTSFKHDLRIAKVTSDIEQSKSIIHDQL